MDKFNRTTLYGLTMHASALPGHKIHLFIHVCVPYVWSLQRGQNRELKHLELVSQLVSARNWTQLLPITASMLCYLSCHQIHSICTWSICFSVFHTYKILGNLREVHEVEVPLCTCLKEIQPFPDWQIALYVKQLPCKKSEGLSSNHSNSCKAGHSGVCL